MLLVYLKEQLSQFPMHNQFDIDGFVRSSANGMQIHVAFDTRTETSKGFAYVQYADADPAVDAYLALDRKHFQGRLLHVLPASAKKTYKIDEYELSKLPLKKQKQIKRKMEAASSSFSWNSLYMNVSWQFFPNESSPYTYVTFLDRRCHVICC